MAKKISNEQMLGQKGVALIESRVLDMGYTWHATNQGLEAGIDGWIELRDPVTGEVSNCWLPVQSKARTEIIESGDFVVLRCEAGDLEYWLSGTAPVIVIYSRPSTRDAWWMSVKDYFKRPESSGTKSIRFHKTDDVFDSAASTRLRALGANYGSSTYFTPRSGSENLISNLIESGGYPEEIFRAETTFRREKDAFDHLRTIVDWPEREWILSDGQIFSFHCLARSPWEQICDVRTLDTLETADWAQSDDQNLKRQFSHLLGKCLGALASKKRMLFSKEQKCHYFKLLQPGKPRREYYNSDQRRADREVVTVFAPEEGENCYYRHTAFESRFRRFEEKWFLEINPTYVFTTDGKTRDKRGPEKLAKIKSYEGDAAVAGTILMFSDLLKEDTTLFGKPYEFLRIGDVARATVGASIDDAAWSAAKANPKPNSAAVSSEDFGRGLFE